MRPKVDDDQLARSFDLSLDLACLVDLKGRFVALNGRWQETLEWPAKDLVGRPFMDLVHPDDREATLATLGALGRGVEVRGFENRYRTRGGAWRTLSWNSRADLDAGLIFAAARDVTDERATEAQAAELGRRLEEAQALSRIGSWEWDVAANRITWTAELYRLYGLDPGTGAIGYDDYLRYIHPDDRQMVDETVKRAFRTGEAFAFDHRLVRPDGTERWLHGRGAVDMDPDGAPVRMAGTAQDITERKVAELRLERALHEKEVLLHEVHHRVKNNLQVVASLLNIQARSAPDASAEQALEESRDRVHAMALVHEALYTSHRFDVIDPVPYLRRVAHDIARSWGAAPRVTVEAPDAVPPIPVDAAVHVGLLVNELVANALEHAYAPGGDGPVTVRFTQDDGDLILEVADQGRGLPADVDVARAETTGLRLVRTMVEQLEGTLTTSGAPGTMVRIRFRPAGE